MEKAKKRKASTGKETKNKLKKVVQKINRDDENDDEQVNVKIQPTSNKKGRQATLDIFNIKIPQPDMSKFPSLPNKGTLKIISWNVNGLRAIMNRGDVDRFIHQEKPDILCFNETKIDLTNLKKEKYDKLHSKNYLSYWNCSVSKAGYSGVAILTKYKPLDVLYGMNLPNHDDEGRVITLEFPDFYILSCYTPNSGEGLRRLDYRTKEWDVEFQDFVDKLKAKKNVIVCGDLNVAHQEIDIHKAKGHENSAGFTQEERESFTKFLDRGYVDTFRYLHPETVKFSYFSKYHKQNKSLNKGWRLDYFIVNKEAIEHVTEADIMTEYDSSDHCPIIIQWKI